MYCALSAVDIDWDRNTDGPFLPAVLFPPFCDPNCLCLAAKGGGRLGGGGGGAGGTDKNTGGAIFGGGMFSSDKSSSATLSAIFLF